jgi:hypothetical protein
LKFKALLAALAIAFGVVAAPATANAAPADPVTISIVMTHAADGSTIITAPAVGFDCNTGMLCLYNDASYAGTVTAYSHPSVGCHTLVGTPADNKVSSLHNYTTGDISMDPSTNCNNFSGFVAHAGQSFQNLATTGYNDLISSFRV